MSVPELLSRLTSLGIRLWEEGGELRYSSPKGALTATLRDAVREHREKIIEHLIAQAESHALPCIPQLPRAENYALSNAQQRVWILAQMEDGSSAYNIPLHVLLEGDLDSDILDEALRAVISRHESLRTTFAVVDGEPRQIVHAPEPHPLDILNLSEHEDAETEARRIANKEATASFNLEAGPPLRTRLLRIKPRRHLLLCTMHHIVSDGVSIGNFFGEITATYNARRCGTPPPTQDLAIQYRDYASWQRQQLKSGAASNHRDYWRAKLDGNLPVLDLPTDSPRPPVQTFRGSEIAFSLGAERSEGLRRFARDNQSSLFMVLLTCLKTLIHRYTGAEHVIIGSPVAGRYHPDLQDQIGLYLNTLPLGTAIHADKTFTDLLAQVRATCLDAFEHQAYPFDKLVEDLQVERDLSRSPVFDVMMILQNQDDAPPAFKDVQSSFLVEHTGTSKVDITFCCKDIGDEIWVNLEYNTDLFHEDRMLSMAEHFTTLVESALAAPTKRIGLLDYLTHSERSCLLNTWNQTKMEYPREKTVVDLVDETARRFGDRVAVVADDGSLTYRELESASNRLAHFLVGHGISREDLVGLCVERTTDTIIALLAILKAGAGYVPLDPHHPPSRLRDILVDADVGLLLTTSKLREALTDVVSDVAIVCLDEERKTILAQQTDRPTIPVEAHQVCYVIYTSGSTGRPKGVVVPHRALVNFLYSMRSAPGLSAEDALLAVTTLTFDIAALELFLPLITGARLVLASQTVAADASRLGDLIESEAVTTMQATPATWTMLIDAGWRGKPDLKILCGGEALPGTLARQLVDRGAEVWNLYGPTETTIWSTLCKLNQENIDAMGNDASVSIGRPIGNTEIYILDAGLQPVAGGVSGELYIGGDGLALGYHRRPDLTEERFVPHPFSSDSNDRLYRTGDLARYRPNGDIEFLGRNDHQVKIRGFRIEIGEVEGALLAYPSVRQAVVVAIGEANGGGSRLIAYLVGEEALLGELRASLRDRLPDYMIPSLFHYLEAFPLTPSRKIDRKALPEPNPEAVGRTTTYLAPRDSVESEIARTWQETLGLTRIGVHDNFFELGGHSLAATRAIFLLQREADMPVELADLFRSPSIEGLAQTIRSRSKETDQTSIADEGRGNSTTGSQEPAAIDEMTALELALLEE